MRKIVEGGSDRSYGIQVARLAGLPRVVIARAQEVLARLETGMSDQDLSPDGMLLAQDAATDATLPPPHLILDEMRQMDLFKMTPLEALNKLSEMKERLQQEASG